MEEDKTTSMQDMLAIPPLMRRITVNDKSTISSNITMENCMCVVESNMVTTNTNIGNLNNSVNYMNHMLSKLMKELMQGTNIAPAEIPANINEQNFTTKKY